jgi:hypothetical protein
MRGVMEWLEQQAADVPTGPDREQFDEIQNQRFDPHVAWVKSALYDSMTDEEKAANEDGRGEMPEQSFLDCFWSAEGLGVLLWALGKEEMRPWDASFPPQGDLLTNGGLYQDPAVFAAEARLRPASELDSMRTIAEIWNWRARTERLIRGGKTRAQYDLRAISTDSANRGYGEGLLPPPINDDFPVYGVGYRDVDERQQIELASIAQERHRALNWLCGYGESWDNTPTGT